MIQTVTTWLNDHEFESDHLGNKIKVDGAKKKGHGPKALLLSALAGCSGIDIVDVLKKMRVDFSDFTIVVDTEQTEEHPKVFKDIRVTYKMKTAAENEDKVRKAIELSLEKYCGVSAMLKKNSAISYTLELLK
ncbi:MAG TPA: OsmC family protein [Chitinophagaceae bacterium]